MKSKLSNCLFLSSHSKLPNCQECALGLSDNGANVLMISTYPLIAAQWIGVNPSESGALGFSDSGANILTISRCPSFAATLIGVNPLAPGALGLSDNGANILRIPNVLNDLMCGKFL